MCLILPCHALASFSIIQRTVPMLRFRPRLLDELQSYDRTKLLGDLSAGLTVAAVALPLAMAFAIASGLKPEAGLFTAIVAGFLISALGGSPVQIGGPAGAFFVLVFAVGGRHGGGEPLLSPPVPGGVRFLLGGVGPGEPGGVPPR